MEAIIAAIIGGGFALLAAYLQYLLRQRDRQLENSKKQIESSRKALSTATPAGDPDLVFKNHRYLFDLKNDGSCSLKRRVILHYEGTKQIATKKFRLHHEGIDSYLEAKGKSLEGLNPDNEFGIEVVDENSRVRQDAWTYITGDHRETFETTVKLDNPLTSQHRSVTLLITYENLDVSFFWKKLYEEHRDEWFEVVHEDIEEYELIILFPKDLPDWFRKADIGLSLIPPSWGSVTQDLVDSRRRIKLQAKNLEHDNTYRMRIDAG